LIVMTSALLGSSIAFVIDLILNQFRKTVFLIIIFLIALIPILEIYFLPQVYFYSPLIGFFPGNIYDEGLSPDWKLFQHQLIVSVFSTIIIFSILRFFKLISKNKIVFTLTIIIAAAVFQYFAADLGYNTTYTKLDRILHQKYYSKLFYLHYDEVSSDESRYITYNIMYYCRQLENILKVKPSKQIHIYLFNNRQQKKELFGAGNADVAKPWQYSIYISADSWESTLKHELVHVFSAEFGTGPFKLAAGLNPALIEGIAEAIEGTTDEISLKDFTSLAFNHNHQIDVNSLFSGLNFFKSGSSLAYTYSGAFIHFLIQKYGIEKVKSFYSSGDFQSTFNSDITLNKKEFEKELKETPFGNISMADYYFGRLSILQKVCPRFISDRLIIAFEYLESKKYQEAEKLFNEINNKTLNYSAIIGLSEVYLKKNKTGDGIKLLKNSISKFANTPYFYNLIFRLGNLYAIDKQNELSSSWYNKIVAVNPNYHFDYLIKTRLSLLKENKLQTYLIENDSVKLKMLVELNDSSYNYNSIPIILDLLESQKVNYDKSISIFNKTFIVDNLESSYSAFKLSKYMLANLDFENGRKYAALSLRYKNENPFYTAMKANYNMANYFYINIKNITRFNY